MKNKIIHIRVNTEDETRWRREAEKLGLDLSSYVRMLLNLEADETQRARFRAKMGREDDGKR